MICEHPEKWARGSAAQSTCYRVLLWEDCALPESSLSEWRAARADVLARMRDAGIKGSRGVLAQLANELADINQRYIQDALTGASAGVLPARPSAIVACLREDAAVHGYRMAACSVQVVLELQGEEGVDAHLTRWKAAADDVTWCTEPLVEAISPAQAEEWLQDCRLAMADRQAEEEMAAPAQAFHHVTVLAEEAVAALQPAEGKVMVDATLGGGGHTELMLKAGARVWGIDQDPAARRAARERLAAYGNRLQILAGNFREAARLLAEQGVEQVDGLLADIGISSPQVDNPERGFSFLSEGPLDMRMNPSAPRSAADLVNSLGESELADILYNYGEERAARAIARRIVREREKAPIRTTTQLADIISSVLPRKGKQHPATRSFQALRIAVNDELGALEALLADGLSLLRSGGRFAVITFHSLEDRAVKRYFDRVTRPEIDRPEWPAPRPNPEYAARSVFRKPVTAGEAELSRNPRSRSAKLRVIEKL